MSTVLCIATICGHTIKIKSTVQHSEHSTKIKQLTLIKLQSSSVAHYRHKLHNKTQPLHAAPAHWSITTDANLHKTGKELHYFNHFNAHKNTQIQIIYSFAHCEHLNDSNCATLNSAATTNYNKVQLNSNG